jgi:acyl transferase domain-containing protein/acyl carrier protein
MPEGYDLFDATFFGFSHREAEITDPQHRVFLECAWEALEMAGYGSGNEVRPVGVYGGATINTYLLYNLLPNSELLNSLEPVQINIGNGGDFLTTRVSYKLNLKGPSHVVQSACSTSLTAVHLACQSLLNEECDLALAGGVSINISQRGGYKYSEGGMASPDGHCRAFDARSQGTIFGSGVGIVALKRLVDAISDRDAIHAVIIGSAINNDGSLKVGYTAPSVDGQAAVIVEALAMAGVEADTISYIETHGTGTPLGDPVEIAALTKAFRASADQNHFCAIGSVKTNIGHLDAAAGIAGLIKTVLALKHRQLPASLHYQEPNPQIDFANSPFYVNSRLQEWRGNASKLRAGVSSFGVGGTNAHVILQEAPPMEPSGNSRSWQLLTLSARTENALTAMAANLADHLASNADLNLADVAYTLQVGRKRFPQRYLVVARDLPDAVEALSDSGRSVRGVLGSKHDPPPLTFMFTGQGAQYINMGRHLYEHETLFRQVVDRSALIIKERTGLELLAMLYPKPEEELRASRRLQETSITQPALFVIEYALAQLLLSWGVQPQALVGHSIGEYVAACVAGVFTLEDALSLVASRGSLMQELPGGEMLAVPLSEFELQPFLNGETAIAAINGPNRCTIAGPHGAVEELTRRLRDGGISFRHLHTSHAFHSPMMEPVRSRFRDVVASVELRPPTLPYLSNLTGAWMTAEDAMDPDYWANHICATVRFADNLAKVLANENAVLLEVGPGQTLTRLARQHPDFNSRQVLTSAMRHPEQSQDDMAVMLTALGHLWLAGIEPDWNKFYEPECRRRVSLPTYPFERQRYWIEPVQRDGDLRPTRSKTNRRVKADDWFYIPSWRRFLPEKFDRDRLAAKARRWLLFADELGIAEALNRWLRSSGQFVTVVRRGKVFNYEDGVCAINLSSCEDYELLTRTLSQAGQLPDVILHLWCITASGESLSFLEAQRRGLFSLTFLLQAMSQIAEDRTIDLQIVTNQLFALTSGELSCPEKATLLGMARVIPHEFPSIRCQILDMSAPEGEISPDTIAQILAAAVNFESKTLAYRHSRCWERTYQAVVTQSDEPLPLRQGGAYLLTGGLLEVGVEMARYLAKTLKARLILIEDENFPKAEMWDEWLTTYGASDTVSQRIRDARHLSTLGAEVLVVPANLSDPAQVEEAVVYAVNHFGPLNGVIHNARVVGERSFRTIKETGVRESEWQFVPKVYGTINLARAVAEQPLDFCLLNSSLSSVLGGVGMLSYASVNSFMDAFASQRNREHPGLWISVNWDAWQNTQVAAISPEWAEVALTPEEGIEALTRILTLGCADQVVVSTIDIWSRIERTQKRTRLKEQKEPANSQVKRHPRPHLSTAYVSPGSDRERVIAEIWQRALGVEKIGVLDNFFDLGGDSLLAIQTAAELRNAFQLEIPAVSMYEGLTIRSLARLLGELQKNCQPSAAEGGTNGAEESELAREKISERQMLQQKQRARRNKRAQHPQ